MVVQILRNLWFLSVREKPTSFFPFSLKYCKDIANLLFWVLWECLTISHQKSRHQSVGNFMLICMQKINFITDFFFKMLQINSKLVILGNLDMSGHTHLKWQYQFEEIFDVYLEVKNQLHSSCFHWDIAEILLDIWLVIKYQ